eukprot:scpid13449/ scgid14805/ Integrin alpha-8; Integrin alpha-8 heavy chain; Integrin alpha-8 light chain
MTRLVLLLGLASVCLVHGFNIEVRQVVRKVNPGNPGELFGTSVAFHATTSDPATAITYLVIGAPYANRTALAPGGVNTEMGYENMQPGAVYTCSDLTASDRSTDCGQLVMDQELAAWWPILAPGDTTSTSYTGPFALRRNGLFGYSVTSTQAGQPFRACGPTNPGVQYIFDPQALSSITESVYRPVGYCIDADATLQNFGLTRFCYDDGFTSRRAQPCVAGVSSTVTPDPAGGATDGFFTVLGFAENGKGGGRYGPRNTDRFSVQDEAAGEVYEFGLNGGYATAMAYGRINVSDVNMNFAVASVAFVGSPKGTQFAGEPSTGWAKGLKLAVFNTFQPTLKANIMLLGEQALSAFGTSIVVGQFDENPGGDVVVGAPHYNRYDLPRNYDNGAVYYYTASVITENWRRSSIVEFATNESVVSTWTKRFIGVNGALFGYSMGNIGDLNRDGFQELAVGSPGINTVTVYYGRPGGLSEANVQVFSASTIQGGVFANALNSFGSSISTNPYSQALSKGWDMDNNKYPDIIVGAPSAESVVYLKSRPVAHLNANFTFSPAKIDFDNCQNNVCFTARVCYFVDTVRSVSVKATGPLTANLSLCEATANSKCVSEVDGAQERITLSSFNRNNALIVNPRTLHVIPYDDNPTTPSLCFTFNATLGTNIEDRLAPIRLLARWTVEDRAATDVNMLTPIGTRYGQQDSLGTLDVVNTCAGIICKPDLYIINSSLTWTGESTDHIIVGRDNTLHFSVSVGNRADPATTPTVNVTLPPGVVLASSDAGSTCTASTLGTGSLVRCILANPFERDVNATVGFTVSLSSRNIDSSLQSLSFPIIVLPNELSTPERSSLQGDNTDMLTVALRREASFEQSGTIIQGSTITLTSTAPVETPMSIAQIGPVVTIRFSLLNPGPSSLPMATVRLEYPEVEKTNAGVPIPNSYLLYLSALESVEDGTVCNHDEALNPSDFTLSASEDTPMSSSSLNTSRVCTNASAFYCTRRFQCTFSRIAANGARTLQMTFRLSNRTFYNQDPPRVPSTLTIGFQVESVLQSSDFTLRTETGSSNFLSFLITNPTVPVTETANIGVIVGSAVGGLALIIIILLILFKLGFFKRKQYGDEVADGGYEGATAPADHNEKVTYTHGNEQVEMDHKVQSNV